MNVNSNLNKQKILSTISNNMPKGIDKKTYEYLENRKIELINKNTDYKSLMLYDLNIIKMIHKGIGVFKNFTISDFLLFEKLESVLLQTGCKTQCRHCGAESSSEVVTMKWEHFLKFTNGLKKLTKRLGFCPINEKNQIGFFQNSDPMHLKMKDKNNKFHSIFEAAKKFFNATSTDGTNGIKTIITTAGWNKKDKFLQQAAEDLVNNPKYIDRFIVSISPFHGWMNKSRSLREKSQKIMEESELYKETDLLKSTLLIAESEQLDISANKIETAYIDMISNALKTSIKFKDKKSIILLYHPDKNTLSKGYEYKDAQGLYDKIKHNLLKENIDLDKYFSLQNIEYRDIKPVGRAENLFSSEDVDKYIELRNYYLKYSQSDMTKILPDGRIVINEAMQGSFVVNYKNPQGKELKLNFK
jgi:hypothetical protein